MSTPVVWRYTGQDVAHYHGVPARDLTEDDLARLDDDQRAAVESGVIYEPGEAPPAESRRAARHAAPAATGQEG